ncbi:hypothetical protein GCM10011351_05540 [Paraliobacillus quinghaiensis]|uniref:Transcobalamin-like C-terminal domain-containing protein n=1 Tax=Paraliobacillus quinghaiensis TaxID=470815 RepID=A0A917WR80_9BACI|nr:DUF4430 domain-containing protein [Paraliobacillus quinghaiensis]GGM22627.1 hypothetical protein GCM10011351_05540 [Paraliobacillus quinghaiensis]
MKKQIILLFTLLISLTILFGCAEPEPNDSTSESNSDDTVTITISKDNGAEVISTKSVGIEQDDVLLDVLRENFEVEVTSAGFVTSIEGISQDDDQQLYWLYEVNGESPNVGAGEYNLSPDDVVVFDLHGMD